MNRSFTLFRYVNSVLVYAKYYKTGLLPVSYFPNGKVHTIVTTYTDCRLIRHPWARKRLEKWMCQKIIIGTGRTDPLLASKFFCSARSPEPLSLDLWVYMMERGSAVGSISPWTGILYSRPSFVHASAPPSFTQFPQSRGGGYTSLATGSFPSMLYLHVHTALSDKDIL